MSVKVIGAGMGRTGTLSMKHALEALGYSKCHHMMEVIQNPPQLAYWKEMEKSRTTDFDAMLNGYEAAVDFPGSLYYKELMQKYPDAKVVLTIRPAEKWYKSVSDTIYNLPRGPKRLMMKIIGIFKPEVGHIANVFDYVDNAIWGNLFKGRFEDKEFAIQRFDEWTEEVKRVVPKDKLLIFEVTQGWEPLCTFLNKPIPDIPFPRVNDTAEFLERKKNKFKH